MTTFYRPSMGAPAPAARLDLMRRRPQRVTSTFSWATYQQLQERADLEGRSLSNLVAFLVETQIQHKTRNS